VEQNGVLIADYGQRSIGRISSVDASLWWPVLCWLYVQHSRDVEFGASQKVQRGEAPRCCSCPTAPHD